MVAFPIYSIMRRTAIMTGTRGGPSLYAPAYAHAVFIERDALSNSKDELGLVTSSSVRVGFMYGLLLFPVAFKYGVFLQ